MPCCSSCFDPPFLLRFLLLHHTVAQVALVADSFYNDELIKEYGFVPVEATSPAGKPQEQQSPGLVGSGC